MSRDLRPVPGPARGRTLASVRRELERWRKDPARTWRVPDALWRAATDIARELGVSKTSRELGLDYYALGKRLRSRPRSRPREAFVELPWPAIATGPDYRLELEDGRRARLRVELRGAARTDVEALARVLWSAAR